METEVQGTRSWEIKNERCYDFGIAVQAPNGIVDTGHNMCTFYNKEGRNYWTGCESMNVF